MSSLLGWERGCLGLWGWGIAPRPEHRPSHWGPEAGASLKLEGVLGAPALPWVRRLWDGRVMDVGVWAAQASVPRSDWEAAGLGLRSQANR